MKQGSNASMVVEMVGILPRDVNSVIFTFKDHNNDATPVRLTKTFQSGSTEVTYDAELAQYFIHFTQTETAGMGEVIYMQAQINFIDGLVDFSDIVRLDVDKALKVVVVDNG